MVVAAGVRLREAGVAEIGGVEAGVEAGQDRRLGTFAEGRVQQVLPQRCGAAFNRRYGDAVREVHGPAEHARVVVGPVERAHAPDLAVVVNLYPTRRGAVATCQHVLDTCNEGND